MIDRKQNLYVSNDNLIYITCNNEISYSDCWVINYGGNLERVPSTYWGDKVVLTNDERLIKDGVQRINDELIDWLHEISHFEYVKVNKVFYDDVCDYVINKNDSNYLDIESLESASKIYGENKSSSNVFQKAHSEDFVAGAEWQSKRMFSEEDFKCFARTYYREIKLDKSNLLWETLADKCLEEFKKSKNIYI